MRRIAIALFSIFICISARAESVDVSVLKAPLEGDATGGLWVLSITSHIDKLNIIHTSINRGNCKSQFHDGNTAYPRPLHFGEQISIMTINCDPIEILIQSKEGEATIDLSNGENNNEIYLSKGTTYLSDTFSRKKLRITSYNEYNILNMTINRNNCGQLGFIKFHNPTIMKFGDHFDTPLLQCDPIEVNITTDKGPFTFNFDK